MENKKTNQEQFEADYLAVFPTCSVDLRKLDLIDEYIHPITGFTYQVWLQQAKRHEVEIAELVEALKDVYADVDSDVIRIRPSDRTKFLETLTKVGEAIAKYEVKK